MAAESPGYLMISLGELALRAQRNPRTVRRWLDRKGISPHGYGILLSDLQARWPVMYTGLLAALQGPPPCPRCSTPMRCECPVCE